MKTPFTVFVPWTSLSKWHRLARWTFCNTVKRRLLCVKGLGGEWSRWGRFDFATCREAKCIGLTDGKEEYRRRANERKKLLWMILIPSSYSKSYTTDASFSQSDHALAHRMPSHWKLSTYSTDWWAFRSVRLRHLLPHQHRLLGHQDHRNLKEHRIVIPIGVMMRTYWSPFELSLPFPKHVDILDEFLKNKE